VEEVRRAKGNTGRDAGSIFQEKQQDSPGTGCFGALLQTLLEVITVS
jgi:hypothetical protein